jgi:hypothetical protein
MAGVVGGIARGSGILWVADRSQSSSGIVFSRKREINTGAIRAGNTTGRGTVIPAWGGSVQKENEVLGQ